MDARLKGLGEGLKEEISTKRGEARKKGGSSVLGSERKGGLGKNGTGI